MGKSKLNDICNASGNNGGTYIANNINLYNSITNSTLSLPLWNNPSCRNTTPRATRL